MFSIDKTEVCNVAWKEEIFYIHPEENLFPSEEKIVIYYLQI